MHANSLYSEADPSNCGKSAAIRADKFVAGGCSTMPIVTPVARAAAGARHTSHPRASKRCVRVSAFRSSYGTW